MDDLEQEYASIQEEIDKYRVDEWHSLVPLMEDSDGLLDRLMDLSNVNTPQFGLGTKGLFFHKEEQGHIPPSKLWKIDSDIAEVFILMLEDVHYIYQALVCDYRDSHHGCRVSQLTRLDKKRKV